MSLDAIGVISGDLKKSVKFYGLLGIALKGAGGDDHLEGQTPSGVRLMVDSVALIKSFNKKYKKPKGSGVVLCFRQANAKAVDALYKKIVSAGFKSVHEPWDAFWGQRYACVSDPDGNQVDLFAQL
ncbi:MAG: VOC family protein [Myxococcaceae bacterium]